MSFYIACDIFNSLPHKTTIKSLKCIILCWKIATTYFGYTKIFKFQQFLFQLSINGNIRISCQKRVLPFFKFDEDVIITSDLLWVVFHIIIPPTSQISQLYWWRLLYILNLSPMALSLISLTCLSPPLAEASLHHQCLAQHTSLLVLKEDSLNECIEQIF